MEESRTIEELGENELEEEGGDGSTSLYGFDYLIVNPHKASVWSLLSYALTGDVESGLRFLEASDHQVAGRVAADHRLVILVSVIARRLLVLFREPMALTGCAVDFLLNLISQNCGILGLLLNLVLGKVILPRSDTETFISTIGHLDLRTNLRNSSLLAEVLGGSTSVRGSVKLEPDDRALMDLCIMASKLAYENARVVENVVNIHWKMHFVEFFECWNDYQEKLSTQAFIFCDKPKDAKLIMISFRGTEPFDADDWCTDLDYSWYEIPKLGRVHMGFLEALGLGSRASTLTFRNNLLKRSPTTASSEEAITVPDMAKKSAYYSVKRKLNQLLEEHNDAKFMVTGHSLGGALAILFPTVLVVHEESEIMKRMLGVYTFGQPRVGDRYIREFMNEHLQYPIQKYFRVVYCNDVVPRLPYDNKTFLYKHFGVCLYYDSFYKEKRTGEEPNPNYSGLRNWLSAHLNAGWELMRALTLGYIEGPEYKEGWFCILLRVLGLIFPGLSAHCPTDYVNSSRLGSSALQMSSL